MAGLQRFQRWWRQNSSAASTLALIAIAALAIGSVAASDPSRPRSYCPAARADGPLPVACPPRTGQPLSHALGFGAVVLATAWRAQRRTH